MNGPKLPMASSRPFSALLAFLCFTFQVNAADVLFYGWGKGKNFQQTAPGTTVSDAVDPWEATSFVWLNPAGGALIAAYFGTAANPMLYPLNNGGANWQVGDSETSQ